MVGGPAGLRRPAHRTSAPAGGLLEQIQNTRVVRCDEAAWRFLGLSLAGYNALISLALAAIARWGALGSVSAGEDRRDGGRVASGGSTYGSSSVSQ